MELQSIKKRRCLLQKVKFVLTYLRNVIFPELFVAERRFFTVLKSYGQALNFIKNNVWYQNNG